MKSKASPHLTSPQLTSPTSGYKWSQVATSGFTWLKVDKGGDFMWLSGSMWLSGCMWLKVAKSAEKL